MAAGQPEYRELYGWLRKREGRGWFQRQVLEPMSTAAIMLSDATDGWWKVRWGDRLIHNRFYRVSSTYESNGITTT